jgi:antitoxin (DNA-binding transcriptional repressor) of toxin-antitoxin stability system
MVHAKPKERTEELESTDPTVKTITATELARNLSDILNRVHYKGEHFVVKRNGELVAEIRPARPKPGITVRELIERIGDLYMPGDGFADDLEAIHAAQGVAEFPEWPA